MSKQIPLSCFLVVILAVGCAKRQQPKSVPAPVAPVSLGTPTIPAKSQWKSNMVTLGQKWATWLDNPKNTPLAFGVESEVWYYDGGRAFQQIASYTRDPKWNKYADQILSAYADYVITNNGGIPGYRVFSRGLLMGFQRTGNAKYQQALNALVYGSRSVTVSRGRTSLLPSARYGNQSRRSCIKPTVEPPVYSRVGVYHGCHGRQRGSDWQATSAVARRCL